MHGEIIGAGLAVVDRILMVQKIAVASGTLLSNSGGRGFTVAGTWSLLEGMRVQADALR